MPGTAADTATKRYNLVLPEALYAELQQVAAEHDTTVVDLLRQSIKLGLLAIRLQDEPDAGIFYKDGAKESKIYLVPNLPGV